MESTSSGGFAAGILRMAAFYFLGMRRLDSESPQQVPHSGGDGFPPGELVRRHRGASPRHMMAPPRRCQGIKCPRTGAGARVRSALERGGHRSRAERTLERGGARSR
jgi:hypothetical protein